MTVDGLNIGNPPGGNQPPGYVADVGNAQEITFTTSGGLGESETAGLVMNIVPKTGGNTHSGIRRSSAAPARSCRPTTSRRSSRMPASRRRRRSRRSTTSTAPFGGPIKKDRVWYFVNARTQGSTQDDREQSTTT